MPNWSTYIWKDLDKPFKKYAKAKKLARGTIINSMLQQKLSEEGYL